MIPTITQQLKTLKLRMEETIIPALPSDAAFAHEQANLMLATLNWMLDTHEHQYRYEVVENAEYRQLLTELASFPDTLQTDISLKTTIEEILSESGPEPTEAIIPLNNIIDQNRRMKEITEEFYEQIRVHPNNKVANQAQTLLAKLAIRQAKLEVAFFRMTGFPKDAPELRAVLDEFANSKQKVI
ncbi:hypothetical protein [Bacillus sp. B15-48]|uniref:hypothetical protein n=1 Tax=Bacillus sp. B15-48 TaxID=1548601 RepID=UPI00193F6557|nr:hypothetical protein [Bacillus sp. B15-48]MBM4763764.1 hypothetical protein [Bacillus sp. B15-48]